MTEERAVLAGGCFWGVQDLIRRYDGVLSTRAGYTGGSVPHATYRNHGSHAEAVEVIFDPVRISFGRSSNSSSRFTTQARAIARATTSGPATGLRSSTPVTSRSGLPKTPSPTSMLQACGRARSLQKSFRQATSGSEPEHQDYLQRYPDGYTCHFVRPNWRLPIRTDKVAKQA